MYRNFTELNYLVKNIRIQFLIHKDCGRALRLNEARLRKTKNTRIKILTIRGGSRIFSRGGRIFKKFSKILTTFFFRSTKLLARPKLDEIGQTKH